MIGMILDNEFTGDMRVENEVIALREAGFEVAVLCFNFGNKPSREDFHGAKIIRRPAKKFLVNKTKPFIATSLDIYSLYWSRIIREFVTSEKVTVLHVHDLFMVPAALKARNSSDVHYPIVADLHENYPAALKYYKFANTFPGNLIVSVRRWEKAEIDCLQEVDAVITVIEEALERYVELGAPRNKLTVVANYVNEREFLSSPPLPAASPYSDQFVLTYIGGFDIHRGLAEVIAALPDIRKTIPEILLVLVGSGANRSDLEAQAADLGVSDAVVFEGWQPSHKLPDYIRQSDVCLIPHLKTEHTDNTIPHKLFHYMLLQKPVIASNCAPIERILRSAEAGLTYSSGDSSSFAKAVQDLYQNGELRERMGQSGQTAVKDRFLWKHTSVNLTALHTKLATND